MEYQEYFRFTDDCVPSNYQRWGTGARPSGAGRRAGERDGDVRASETCGVRASETCGGRASETGRQERTGRKDVRRPRKPKETGCAARGQNEAARQPLCAPRAQEERRNGVRACARGRSEWRTWGAKRCGGETGVVGAGEAKREGGEAYATRGRQGSWAQSRDDDEAGRRRNGGAMGTPTCPNAVPAFATRTQRALTARLQTPGRHNRELVTYGVVVRAGEGAAQRGEASSGQARRMARPQTRITPGPPQRRKRAWGREGAGKTGVWRDGCMARTRDGRSSRAACSRTRRGGGQRVGGANKRGGVRKQDEAALSRGGEAAVVHAKETWKPPVPRLKRLTWAGRRQRRRAGETGGVRVGRTSVRRACRANGGAVMQGRARGWRAGGVRANEARRRRDGLAQRRQTASLLAERTAVRRRHERDEAGVVFLKETRPVIHTRGAAARASGRL
ncbi:hypothetical protein B0H14DRAFT_3134341 [Mycena olivaceomarginata]|nr:hypothetical protein B0H14DRAFT_3134341 [Mycena olivaceomarginata]